MHLSRCAWPIVAAALLGACSPAVPPAWQGYVEAEYTHVAAAEGGRLSQLLVQRGQQVAADAPLFVLEADNERHQLDQARQQLRAAEAQLADQRSGRRPPELAVVQAQLLQAEAERQRSADQARRDQAQFDTGGISRAQLEQSQTAARSATARVQELRDQLAVQRLPARAGQLQAQAAQAESARAVLAQAQWRLDQKALRAPTAALVADTLYRPGEWVAAGKPVLRLLAPGDIKLRFFVPQDRLAALKPGAAVQVVCDGCGPAMHAQVTFIAPEAEYTPPVIYSESQRAKLVFMVEARPAATDVQRLKPGQPVEVSL